MYGCTYNGVSVECVTEKHSYSCSEAHGGPDLADGRRLVAVDCVLQLTPLVLLYAAGIWMVPLCINAVAIIGHVRTCISYRAQMLFRYYSDSVAFLPYVSAFRSP